MITKTNLENFYKSLLEPERFKDFGPNGIQINKQTENVYKIGFAVTATKESIRACIENDCDVLVVHHGLFWNHQGSLTITGKHGDRILDIVKNNMCLMAYHLPLDVHIEIGNAAVLAKLIGIPSILPFGDYKGSFTGVCGGLIGQNITVSKLKELLAKKLDHDVIVSTDDPNKIINKVGIITGAAQHEWKLAKDEGFDAFITGEINHHCWTDSREADLTMFACGHEATEELGIKALMEKTKEHFGDDVAVEFIKSHNPV